MDYFLPWHPTPKVNETHHKPMGKMYFGVRVHYVRNTQFQSNWFCCLAHWSYPGAGKVLVWASRQKLQFFKNSLQMIYVIDGAALSSCNPLLQPGNVLSWRALSPALSIPLFKRLLALRQTGRKMWGDSTYGLVISGFKCQLAELNSGTDSENPELWRNNLFLFLFFFFF